LPIERAKSHVWEIDFSKHSHEAGRAGELSVAPDRVELDFDT
jgi:hypothetical protein